MMNQQYGFSGRGRRSSEAYSRAPYRRQMPRGMTDHSIYPYSHSAQGCGCGSNGRLPTNHDMKRSGCGCASACTGSDGYRTRNSCESVRKNEGNNTCANPINRPDTGSSCGDKAACHKLLDQIRAIDFALYEVILYLDVYPHSCDALETYHKLKEQRDALHREYQSACGPLTAFCNESTTSWDWIDKPFPWEYITE